MTFFEQTKSVKAPLLKCKLFNQSIDTLLPIRILALNCKEHSSLMVTVAGLDSGIYNGPGFAPASGQLVFCVPSASETGT